MEKKMPRAPLEKYLIWGKIFFFKTPRFSLSLPKINKKMGGKLRGLGPQKKSFSKKNFFPKIKKGVINP